eukprot:63164-Prymnesium_polylepis.2
MLRQSTTKRRHAACAACGRNCTQSPMQRCSSWQSDRKGGACHRSETQTITLGQTGLSKARAQATCGWSSRQGYARVEPLGARRALDGAGVEVGHHRVGRLRAERAQQAATAAAGAASRCGGGGRVRWRRAGALRTAVDGF